MDQAKASNTGISSMCSRRYQLKQMTASALAVLALCAVTVLTQANEVTLYRYTNDEGVKVINSSIPAKYAQNGYEIINTSGEVLKRVAAAPSQDDIDKANEEREILNTYNLLKRRYSKLEDIERAKTRRLENIDTSIVILKGAISNLELNIKELVQRAAEQERAGRQVHKSLLKQLKDTRAELEISEDLLKYREEEHSETAKRYDDDVRAFIRGATLERELKAQQTNEK